jgi:hypothetical protein
VEPAEAVATISSLASMASQAATALRAAMERAKTGKSKQDLSQAYELVLSLQSSLLDFQAQALQLQAENAELRSQIRQHQERTLDRDKYELKTIGRDAAVVPKGESRPLYCPNCYQDGKLRVLGSTGMHYGGMPSHICGACQSVFNLR